MKTKLTILALLLGLALLPLFNFKKTPDRQDSPVTTTVSSSGADLSSDPTTPTPSAPKLRRLSSPAFQNKPGCGGHRW